jgi:hypothetical protein
LTVSNAFLKTRLERAGNHLTETARSLPPEYSEPVLRATQDFILAIQAVFTELETTLRRERDESQL